MDQFAAVPRRFGCRAGTTGCTRLVSGETFESLHPNLSGCSMCSMRSFFPLVGLLVSGSGLLLAQNVGPVFTNGSLVPGSSGMHRCGTPAGGTAGLGGDHPDCDSVQTNPLAIYAPTSLLRIPVVVHVISNTVGAGNLSDAQVQSQITVLNEDYRAQAGTAGAGGIDTMVEFFLATTDPVGNPTTGITRHTNNTWFADGGSYWTSIAWDTSRYLNIYTNNAGGGGVLGYV